MKRAAAASPFLNPKMFHKYLISTKISKYQNIKISKYQQISTNIWYQQARKACNSNLQFKTINKNNLIKIAAASLFQYFKKIIQIWNIKPFKKSVAACHKYQNHHWIYYHHQNCSSMADGHWPFLKPTLLISNSKALTTILILIIMFIIIIIKMSNLNP